MSTNEGTRKVANSDAAKGTEPPDSVRRHADLRNHRIKFEEAVNPRAERVDAARNHDVLFGRGKGYQRHPGNERMREIIRKRKPQYQSLPRNRKRDLVEAVYNEVIEGGARFLAKSPDDSTFCVVDVPIALQKVSNALRCKKRLNAEMENDAAAVDPIAADPEVKQMIQRSTASPFKLTSSTGAIGSTDSVPESSRVRSDQSSSLHSATPASPRFGFGLGSDAWNPMGSLPILAAQRLPVAANYGSASRMPTMQLGLSNPTGLLSGIDYYESIRRDRWIQEMLLLQQLGSARIGGPGTSLLSASSQPHTASTGSSGQSHLASHISSPRDEHGTRNRPSGDNDDSGE